MYIKNYLSKSFLLFLTFIYMSLGNAFCQGFGCGSVPSKEYVNYLLTRSQGTSNKKATAADPSKLATLKTISVTVWIVKDSLRNPNLTAAQINSAFATVNLDYAPMNLAFNVCSPLRYIENFQFDSLDLRKTEHKEKEMYTEFHDEKTINMYFVSQIRMDPAVTGVEFPCGYTYMPGGGNRDLIVIKKECVTSLTTISHELGHFFGLEHTHGSNIVPTSELVNESNCHTTGDFICDTEADPKGTADSNCQLQNPGKDANGDFYTPPIGNIMSYYDPSCKCGFTPQQYALMTDVYLKFRKYLY